MYDENQLLHGTGLDVRQIDTSPQVATCVGQHQLKRALHVSLNNISPRAPSKTYPGPEDSIAINLLENLAHVFSLILFPKVVFRLAVLDNNFDFEHTKIKTNSLLHYFQQQKIAEHANTSLTFMPLI